MVATRRAAMLLLLTALLCVLTVSVSRAAISAADDERTAADDAKQTVTLIIDYGDGVQKHFTALEWEAGMTVLDAMKQAAKHKRGIKLETRGSGETVFLVAIDGLANEAKGPDSKNWLYWVNDEFAKRGLGALTLDADDEVMWKHGYWKDRE